MTGRLAPHESLELHEILRTETISAAKVQAMIPMVSDGDLKGLMQRILDRKQARIQRLRSAAEQAVHQGVTQ